jgi:hypothetical protein
MGELEQHVVGNSSKIFLILDAEFVQNYIE